MTPASHKLQMTLIACNGIGDSKSPDPITIKVP